MHRFVEKTEQIVLWVLTFLLLAGVVLGTVALAIDFFHVLLFVPPVGVIKPETLFHMFGEFLIVLIGIKLIRLVLLSLPGGSSPIPSVIDVALIGLGQKVVTMDVKTQPASTLYGVAALIFALAFAAVAFRTANAPVRPAAPEPPRAPDEETAA